MPRSARFASIFVGLDTLAANPLRTGLSTLGIVMGSASLVAVLAMGDGLERYVRAQIESTTDLQAIALTPQLTRQVEGQRLLRADTIHLGIPEAQGLIRGLTGVGSATLTLSGAAELTPTRAGGPHAAEITAIWFQGGSGPARIASGRIFSAPELASADPVAIVSDTLARSLAGDGTSAGALGVTFPLNGAPFTVVGVLARRSMGEHAMIVVPFGAARLAIPPDLRARTPSLLIASAAVEGTTPLRRAIEARLTTLYGNWTGRMTVASNSSRLEQVRQSMLVFKMVMGAITGVSLLVGGVGIMNVLLAAVAERTREIGIRKAVGARKRDILIQFLAESVAIAGAGSVLGLLLGLGGAFGTAAVIRARTDALVYAGFSWASLAVSALAAILIGLSFGCYPALRAARLSPIDAIRHD